MSCGSRVCMKLIKIGFVIAVIVSNVNASDRPGWIGGPKVKLPSKGCMLNYCSGNESWKFFVQVCNSDCVVGDEVPPLVDQIAGKDMTPEEFVERVDKSIQDFGVDCCNLASEIKKQKGALCKALSGNHPSVVAYVNSLYNN